jgi:hypothetical protein
MEIQFDLFAAVLPLAGICVAILTITGRERASQRRVQYELRPGTGTQVAEATPTDVLVVPTSPLEAAAPTTMPSGP